MVRILFLMMFPLVCFSQIAPSEDIPVNNLLREKKNLDTHRKASYNLDEIKVRWKKAALENCPGVPCVTITIPGAPTGVVATAGNTLANVSFVAPTNNGGSVITGYTVTSNPGGITATGATSPINVTGLTNGTAYTFTVTATNSVGSSVASVPSTSVTPVIPVCSTSSVTDVDGNNYNTVAIGTQCWTTTNLKVTRYNNNTAIPIDATGGSVGTSSTWQNLTTGSYTIYVNEPISGTNAMNYGFLYNWYAAKGIYTTGVIPSTDTLNICPAGWHVPTDSDWNKLVIFIDPGADTTTTGTQSTTAGTTLKKNDALWTTNTGSDDFLFSVLPGGYRFNDGRFLSIRNDAFFWSATSSGANSAWYRRLDLSGDVRKITNSRRFGASVRCLKD